LKSLFILAFINLSLFAQPSWINNPNIDGYLSGVGISNDKNLVSKRRIATVMARANLAETIKVEIKSYIKINSKDKNNKYSTSSESIIEQKAKEVLVSSVIKDIYQDKNGIFYVLVVVKKETIK